MAEQVTLSVGSSWTQGTASVLWQHIRGSYSIEVVQNATTPAETDIGELIPPGAYWDGRVNSQIPWFRVNPRNSTAPNHTLVYVTPS